jgi:hypothetical protein
MGSRGGNWVDQGLPAEPKLARALAVYLDIPPKEGPKRLEVQARTLLQMAAADASEVQVTSYLRSLEPEFAVEPSDSRSRRTMAVALWHIAKAALVRDRLLPLAGAGLPRPTSDQVPLSKWLAERLLRL